MSKISFFNAIISEDQIIAKLMDIFQKCSICNNKC